jgi:tRNA-splicing ligase RtcB
MKQISKNIWEIPKTGKMNVPARVFASEKILTLIKKDNTLKQVKNVASLPGIVGYSLAMPDAHQGYGFSIGGVAAFDLKKGIISPGGVGYDINCGVRLLSSNLTLEDTKDKIQEILHQISRDVPRGVGRGSKNRISKEDLNEIILTGAKWATKNNFGTKEDLEKTESQGCLTNANPKNISQRALARGANQLGTMGAGNHFIDLLTVNKIYDKKTAKEFGIKKENQIMVLIHTGSRGLGHQVASDYIQSMEKENLIKNLPDRELACAPINSEIGQKYFSAMNGAANFAFANRQMIAHYVRKSFTQIFPKSKLTQVYDIAHNIAKIEERIIDKKKQEVCVHRKGATRSLGPNNPEIPKVYRKTGQPIIIPGSMGTPSFLLVGTKKAEEISLASTAHGSGRVMSRTKALQTITYEKLEKQMKEKDIVLSSVTQKSAIQEAPEVYKDSEEVVQVSHDLGIGKLVARMKPVGVLIG